MNTQLQLFDQLLRADKHDYNAQILSFDSKSKCSLQFNSSTDFHFNPILQH